MNHKAILFYLIGIIAAVTALSAHAALPQGNHQNFLALVYKKEPLPPAPPLSNIEGIVTLCNPLESTEQCDIYTIRADGTERQNLTNSPTLSEYFLTASPDGQKIIYFAGLRYYVMDRNGNNVFPLVTPEENRSIQRFEWNEQGDFLYLFGEYCCSNLALYVVRAGTTTSILIANDAFNGYEDKNVGWSPDGSRIAFESSSGQPGNRNVYHVAPDGTDPIRITMNGGTFQAWLTDGTLLVEQEGKPWIVTPDGKTQTRWTAWDKVNGSVDSLSPDNRYILYVDPILVTGEPLPIPFLAMNERTALTKISYQQMGGCYTEMCFLGNSVWSSDSKIVAWVLDTTQQDAGSSNIYYAISPFTQPQQLGVSRYDTNPQLIQQWLFHRSYNETLDRYDLRLFNVETGASQIIASSTEFTQIGQYHEWRLVP